MAVSEKVNSRLQLGFEDGVDYDTGEPIIKTKTFNNVKPEATTDALFAIANALVPLQDRTLYEVKRNDTELITQE